MAEFIGILRDIRDVKYPEIVQMRDEVIVNGTALRDDINEAKPLMIDVLNNIDEVKNIKDIILNAKTQIDDNANSVAEILVFSRTSESNVISISNHIDTINTLINSNLISINQSITAANILKHDVDASTLGASDVNAFLMSTITKADNAQNALDLKVQQNLLALNDIVNDNVMTLESKAQSAGDMIDLKIAMAVQARNDLSIIEQSVLLATGAADKAQLAYEQVDNIKTLVDEAIDEADLKITNLNETLTTAQSINDTTSSLTQTATALKDALQSTYEQTQQFVVDFEQALSNANALDLLVTVDQAKNQADRLDVVIPVAQNLSANTDAAVTMASNLNSIITLGNTLLNAMQDENAKASTFMTEIDQLINDAVTTQVEQTIISVADAKIEEITQITTSNNEAISVIIDADISLLDA